jgi:hypothetical protein
MRFLWGGGQPDDALAWELHQLGHRVTEGRSWWSALQDDETPEKWGADICAQLAEGYDVLVVVKGALFGKNCLWYPDTRVMHRIRKSVPAMIYLCYDDPAFTPVQLGVQLAQWYDAYGTTCPGIETLFGQWRRRMPKRIFEHWLAWDRRIEMPAVEKTVDVAFTGSPYWRPFPAPHYQGGFSCPRRDLVRVALDAGFSVGLWGSDEWVTGGGGDPFFEPYYHGFVPPSQVHLVHASARVCVATHLVEGHRYDSGRLPWLGGAGCCILHEDRPGLREEFGDMVEWFRPGDLGDFRQKLTGLLGDPDRRAHMGRRIRQYVLEHHTWKNRAEDIISVAEKILAR